MHPKKVSLRKKKSASDAVQRKKINLQLTARKFNKSKQGANMKMRLMVIKNRKTDTVLAIGDWRVVRAGGRAPTL